MPTPLTLDTARRADGRLVLAAAGEIDLSNIAQFDQALASATTAADGSGERLIVDLGDLEYLDSAAINALFLRGDLIHVIAPEILMSTLAMTGFTELFPVDTAPPR
ncbi:MULTISPECIES: STAS domain-containing protein [Mycobacteriaceae]|uniref:STAS domain-containing protein n=1 Tax=Mycobacteriaceae TaxID=1762 RepID=UPI0007FC486C|nr:MULTISPECIES: STAS domain-containing protein [Mycobacteriaceae]MCK0175417.1 STAS domain-containing protein [Mycolicibacterium sp. F2034L]OBB59926.1 anti-anti-sigma factor [Mycobacterium sp. 852013-51886_SCH5428379]